MPDQCKPGAGSIGAGSVRLVIEVSRLVPLSVLGFEVHAAGVDPRRTRPRTGILEEDDLAAGPLPLPCRLRAGILARNLWDYWRSWSSPAVFTSILDNIVSTNLLVKRDRSLSGIRFIKNS
jgi:hypothetical protein